MFSFVHLDSNQATSTIEGNLGEVQGAKETRKKTPRRTHARRQTHLQTPGGPQLVERAGTIAAGRDSEGGEAFDLGHLKK